MSILHKVKFKIANIKRFFVLIEAAIKYRKEIKEVDFIFKKKKELTMRMLEIQRNIENNSEIQEIKAKLDILNKLIK